ncbi:MAG TPA: Mur ligase family protein, partial [Mycobacteriales bacterium]|nr:Mur ligase family protein [Mycobacteriales bacterium]
MSTDVERYLDVVARRRTTGGLERIRWICEQLGDPQFGAPTVHITGTNGKGSTARLAAALLQAGGWRTGLYTSPHLVHVGERVLIDGEPLPPAEFDRAIRRLRPVFDQVSEEVSFGPSRFEVFTALALDLFTGVEARVLEVGIGGRLDPTNIVDAEVAVLTNVDLDHVEYLGRERSTIAADKAGIIKPGATAIAGPMAPELTAIVARRCTEVGATLWAAGGEYTLEQQPRPGGLTLTVRTPGRTYRDIDIPFRGAHQGQNAACALASVEALIGPVPEDLVRAAWASVSNPGRFEVFPGAPPIVVDVAHNPHGVAALTAQLAEE